MAKNTRITATETEALEQPPAPLPELKASPIPQIERKEAAETGHDSCKLPCDEDHTHGIFTADGEDYALCIHEPDGYGNTHTLKNSLHLWQGKEAEFNAKFSRK